MSNGKILRKEGVHLSSRGRRKKTLSRDQGAGDTHAQEETKRAAATKREKKVVINLTARGSKK